MTKAPQLSAGFIFLSDFLSFDNLFTEEEDNTACTVADYICKGKCPSEKYGKKAVIGKTQKGNEVEILPDFHKGGKDEYKQRQKPCFYRCNGS